MSLSDIQAAFYASPEYKNSHAGGLERVPFDGYKATLHRGEAVVDADATRALTRYFGGGGNSNAALVAEIKALREDNSLMRAELRAIASHTQKSAKLMERAMPDGDAWATRAVV
jgi:hypothetical protein